MARSCQRAPQRCVCIGRGLKGGFQCWSLPLETAKPRWGVSQERWTIRSGPSFQWRAGGGVDVILDCVGGSYWEANAELNALDGHWILFGLMGGPNVEGPLLAKILRKRVSLIGTTLRTRSIEYKEKLVAEFSAAALPGLADGTLR